MGKAAETGNITLSDLSAADYAKITELTESQYAPDAPPDADSSSDGGSADDAPVPWREHDGGFYPYLVRGAFLRCQYGSHSRRLNLPLSHADYIGEDPTMNAGDNKPGTGVLSGGKFITEEPDINIPPFGVCKAPSGPKGVGTILLKSEKINPCTGQAYTDANNNVMKIEDNVKGPPCTPLIVGQWQNPHQETLIGAADQAKNPAITVGSFLVCKYCGIIEPINSGQTALDMKPADAETAVLPPEAQAEVDAIASDPEASPNEKADKIAAVYENYLLSLAPDAFAEYDAGRRSLDESDPQYAVKLAAIEEELNNSLLDLRIDIRAVLNNMGDDLLKAAKQDLLPPGLAPATAEYAFDLASFAGLVGSGQPLDLKNRPLGKSTATNYDWSIWSRSWNDPQREPSGSLVSRPDYAGNYLFGYFDAGYLDGRLFVEDTLLYGAGAAQAWSDKDAGKWMGNILAGNYGDNPGDSDMIKDGINIYNMTH